MQYQIIELAGKSADGLVLHSIVVDNRVLSSNLNYDDARKQIENSLKLDDTVIEIYQSSGRQSDEFTYSGFMKEQLEIRKKYG